MDKLFEQILKYLPPEIIPVGLAIAAEAFRNYTEVLHDSLFFSTVVVIIAGFLLYRFNKTDEPAISAADPAPLLLVPEFIDDERGQFKTFFIQQVGSALQAITKRDKTIVALNSFVPGQDAARLTAQRYKAIAVIYDPKIVRVGEKVYLCFSLLRVDPDLSKPYPPSAVELDKQVLNDIIETLVIASSAADARQGASPSRLDIVERRLPDLESVVTKLSAPAQSAAADIKYRRRRAIVVGVDEHVAGTLPTLRYSISDARRMASLLEAYNFDVTVLANATSAVIEQAIDWEISTGAPDDLFLFYYAGKSMKSDELKIPGEPFLILGTFDVDLGKPSADLTLPKLVERLKAIPARHKLVIMDACYGTSGLKLPQDSDSTIQIFSGSQDEQYGTESVELGGGIFTSALIGALQHVGEQTSISTEEIFSEVSAQMARFGPSLQRPKLVRAAGADQIMWTRGSRASTPSSGAIRQPDN
jgi:hypothetical protein